MAATPQTIEQMEAATGKYKYGFVTEIQSDRPKKGLDEETIKYISKKKNEPEWMLAWRLDCYKKWLKMSDPQWSNLKFPKISKANLNTKKDNGESTISIFSALKRSFPMKVDMMEKHPLGSQAFIPMKETTFLAFVAPEGNKPDINKIESFIIPKGIGVNYNPGIWHFPLISTEDMNFLVVDRLGDGDNLVLHDLNKENITLEFQV